MITLQIDTFLPFLLRPLCGSIYYADFDSQSGPRSDKHKINKLPVSCPQTFPSNAGPRFCSDQSMNRLCSCWVEPHWRTVRRGRLAFSEFQVRSSLVLEMQLIQNLHISLNQTVYRLHAV